MNKDRDFQGFHLRGDLQLDTAEIALMRHKIDSKALRVVLALKHAQEQLPDEMKQFDTSSAVYINDPEMRQDLIDSLQQELQRTDLDETQRISMEELLFIEQNGQRGLK